MSFNEYKKCIDACLQCAAVCNHCAASCLQEKDVKMMVKCIQLDLECAAICYTAAQLMSLGSSRAED
ncbi:MAG TPA: four-helix bundle copper-binding protein, partial [Chitinophagaceae bacterium]